MQELRLVREILSRKIENLCRRLSSMRIRIRDTHWLPRLFGARGVVLYPYILLAGSRARETAVLAHEWVHVRQMRRDGVLKFYATWLWELLRNIFTYRSLRKAYWNIGYELEARRATAVLGTKAPPRP